MLALLVICEIAGGIAAAVRQDDVSNNMHVDLCLSVCLSVRVVKAWPKFDLYLSVFLNSWRTFSVRVLTAPSYSITVTAVSMPLGTVSRKQ